MKYHRLLRRLDWSQPSRTGRKRHPPIRPSLMGSSLGQRAHRTPNARRGVTESKPTREAGRPPSGGPLQGDGWTPGSLDCIPQLEGILKPYQTRGKVHGCSHSYPGLCAFEKAALPTDFMRATRSQAPGVSPDSRTRRAAEGQPAKPPSPPKPPRDPTKGPKSHARLRRAMQCWSVRSDCVCVGGWGGGLDTPGQTQQSSCDAHTQIYRRART